MHHRRLITETPRYRKSIHEFAIDDVSSSNYAPRQTFARIAAFTLTRGPVIGRPKKRRAAVKSITQPSPSAVKSLLTTCYLIFFSLSLAPRARECCRGRNQCPVSGGRVKRAPLSPGRANAAPRQLLAFSSRRWLIIQRESTAGAGGGGPRGAIPATPRTEPIDCRTEGSTRGPLFVRPPGGAGSRPGAPYCARLAFRARVSPIDGAATYILCTAGRSGASPR